MCLWSLKISRMGAVSVGKDTKLDTGSDEEDDDNTNEQQKTSSDEDEV